MSDNKRYFLQVNESMKGRKLMEFLKQELLRKEMEKENVKIILLGGEKIINPEKLLKEQGIRYGSKVLISDGR